MKKFLVILISLLCLTGCGKTGGEVLEKSLSSMKDMKSYALEMKVKAAFKQNGVETKLDLSVAAFIQDNIIRIDVGDNPIIGAQSVYAQINNEKLKFYLPSTIYDKLIGVNKEDWVWLTTEMDLKKDETNKFENIDIAMILGKDKFVFVDKKNKINHYQMIIDDELGKRVSKATNIENKAINTSLTLDVYIDSKTDYITKISADLKNMLANLKTEETIDLSMIDELSFEIAFSGIGTTVINIPEFVTSNTVSIEEYNQKISDEYFFDSYPDDYE